MSVKESVAIHSWVALSRQDWGSSEQPRVPHIRNTVHELLICMHSDLPAQDSTETLRVLKIRAQHGTLHIKKAKELKSEANESDSEKRKFIQSPSK
ncbi:hypothetical protein llap_1951 [Limosa lapponica baueri]|uniref:Uncharacterized protein n=1 Tax=Limosa lapponica baueri TaxID=1758121 RepID=A0A2I0UP07_LIMLA|nr:hypothetical protein llap_1951 [Limosa lapponica baueri]